MYTQAEAVQDCKAQLAQVERRLATALADRAKCRTQADWRANEANLHQLYMLQYDVKQDLSRCEAGDFGPSQALAKEA